MINPNGPVKSLLVQDNSKIQNEVQQTLQRGELKWNTGATYEEKQEGVKLIIAGLNTMKIWISRESDPQRVQTLNDIYNTKIKDVQQKLDYLEAAKQGTLPAQTNSSQAQVYKKPPGKDGKEAKDDDKSKLESALGDAIVTEKPNVKWTDIAGLIQAKAALQEAVILPIKFPQMFEGARRPWKGILMYGPPGTGKTYLAKACATEAEGTFFSVSASDLISKYVGESEKLIRTLFAMAREKKPSIIFLDEIDSMCGARGEGQNEASRRVITEFLIQMEGVGHDDKGLLVLGATNIPWALDSAIRRRFEKRIYIPLPDEKARSYMFENTLKKNKHVITLEEISDLGKKTEGYSGSDISVVVRDALYEPVRKIQQSNRFKKIIIDGQEKLTPAEPNDNGPQIVEINFMQIESNQLHVPDITYNDCINALTKAKKSVSHDQLKEYEEWTKEFGQEG